MDQPIKLILLKNNSVLADQCIVAKRFFARLRGLIGKKHWGQTDGLWLSPCNSVHMWGMSLAIDVLFLKKEIQADSLDPVYRVLGSSPRLKPWRVFPVSHWHATETLELPEGAIGRLGVHEGDLVAWRTTD